MMGKQSRRHRGCLLAVVLIAAGFWWGLVPVTRAETIEELRESLRAKQEQLKQNEDRIKQLRKEIQLKKREAKTLKDQIEIIDDNIAELNARLDYTVSEMEKTGLEIEEVNLEIVEKKEELAHQKEILASYLKTMYTLRRQSSVTVMLKYETFSRAVSEVSAYEELRERSLGVLVDVKRLKEELEQQLTDLEDFKQALEDLQERQQKQQATLIANKEAKRNILDLTREQEEKYQALLLDAKTAHEEAQAEIGKLDELIREELRRQGVTSLPSVGIMDWPIEPIFGIACEFKCADYPYAYLIGPHSGMDIPAYVGTPIRAVADGYVARVHNANGPGYNYIMLVHGDNISTVYGHVSGFSVQEGQMVTRGAVIGYTGGAPGTNGAGLSTGPHLHFEVRENAKAINPRAYL